LFPGATFTADFRFLTKEQQKAVEKSFRRQCAQSQSADLARLHRGWFMVDDVIGRHENIPYALALNDDPASKASRFSNITNLMAVRYAIRFGARSSSASAMAQRSR